MKHNLEQRSKEWLDFKREKIGSSDCPIIMGESPYSNQLDLWKRKISGVQIIKNHHMERGERLESEALALFNATVQCNCVPQVWTHDKHTWMMASVDGYDEEKGILVEIKCPAKENVNLSNHYMYQLYHQMIVLGIDKGYLFFYWEGGKFDVHQVTLNQSIVDKIIIEEERFLKCVQEFTNPMTDKIIDSDDWKEAVKLFKKKKQESEILKCEMESLREHMVALANEREVECNEMKLMKVSRSGSIDYKSIPELKGVNLEMYRNPPTEFWQLLEKKQA